MGLEGDGRWEPNYSKHSEIQGVGGHQGQQTWGEAASALKGAMGKDDCTAGLCFCPHSALKRIPSVLSDQDSAVGEPGVRAVEPRARFKLMKD